MYVQGAEKSHGGCIAGGANPGMFIGSVMYANFGPSNIVAQGDYHINLTSC